MKRLRPTIDLSYGDQEVLQRVLAEPRKIADALAPDDAIAGNQRAYGTAQVTAMHSAIAGLDIGMLAEAADHQPLQRRAQQALVDLGGLFFQAARLVGTDPALLPLAQFGFFHHESLFRNFNVKRL